MSLTALKKWALPVFVLLACSMSVGAQALTAPVLSSPSNGATGVAASTTVSWSSVATATAYRLEIATTSGFTAPLFLNRAGIATVSSAVTGLAAGTTYYWRVEATRGATTSAWSTTWSFATVGAVALPAPTLSSPTNGATGQALTLTMQWGSVATATSYAMQVSQTSAFTVLTVNQNGLTATSTPVAGLAQGITYYWRANAARGGTTSPWSTVWSFTTNAATVPATPILATPANGATGEPTSLTLTWNAAARATSYTVEVGAAANFATTVFMQSGLTALLSPVSGLAIGTTYYWRVNASNAIGTGAWSTVRNFTTSATPAAPTPIYPAAGSTGEPSTVTLTWNTVAGAATYMLQTSTNNLFATTVSSIAGITGDSLTLSGLSNNSTYFWRVEAVNGLAVSAWSATSWFTVSYSGTLTESHAVIAMPTFGIRNGVISYSLQKSGPVELAVFDLRGRSVFGLNHTQSAGNYAIDLANRSVAPGRYFVWFKAGAFEQRTAMAYYGKR